MLQNFPQNCIEVADGPRGQPSSLPIASATFELAAVEGLELRRLELLERNAPEGRQDVHPRELLVTAVGGRPEVVLPVAVEPMGEVLAEREPRAIQGGPPLDLIEPLRQFNIRRLTSAE